MWEKLADDGSIHDKDLTYVWANAIPQKIAPLNGGAGFAGYNAACAPGCTILTCSCTASEDYWSSSTSLFYPNSGWRVTFSDGNVFVTEKTVAAYVRAVRGGS